MGGCSFCDSEVLAWSKALTEEESETVSEGSLDELCGRLSGSSVADGCSVLLSKCRGRRCRGGLVMTRAFAKKQEFEVQAAGDSHNIYNVCRVRSPRTLFACLAKLHVLLCRAEEAWVAGSTRQDQSVHEVSCAVQENR